MTAGRLLHLAAFDVAPGHEPELDAWFERYHLPALGARPGWTAARRYRCLEGEPRHLVLYDLEQSALGAPRPAPPFAAPPLDRWIRNYHARTYREMFAAGEDPAAAAFVNVIAVDVEEADAPAFNRWYNEVHVPEIVACPGWKGARRYEAIAGDPRLLAVYGLEDAQTPFASDEYEAAVGWDDQVERIRGYHGFRIYGLVSRTDTSPGGLGGEARPSKQPQTPGP